MSKPGVLRIAALFAGLVALLVGYYWIHKPISLSVLQSAGGALLDVLTVGVLVAIAGAAGRRILSRIDLSIISRPERLALETIIGLSLISWIALLFGLIGLLKAIALWPALLLIGALVIRDLKSILSNCKTLIPEMFHPESLWVGILSVTLCFLLLLALLSALAPPYAWDAMSYHLVGPARYLAAGRIATQPDNHFLGFPQSIEMLYSIVRSLFGRDTAPALVHFTFGVLALLAVGGITSRYAGKAAGWLAATLLISGLSLWLLFGQPYVDLATMAYGALVLVTAVCWRETQKPTWLILMGLCAGLALGVKYTSVSLLLALIIYVTLQNPRRAVRNNSIMIGMAVLTFIPWMVKGALLYGNPIYPYLFGGVSWDALRNQTFNTFGSGLLSSHDAWQLAILPIAATIFGVERGPEYSFTVGPWLLTLPFLLILGWKWLDDRSRQLAVNGLQLGLPLLAFWIVLSASAGIGIQTRLMTVALPASAVLGSLGFSALKQWPSKPVNIHFILSAVLVLTFALEGIEALETVVQTNALSYIVGLTSRDDFLTHNLGAYIDSMRELGTLPTGSQVRFLWEPRSYYCPPTIRCMPDILFDYWLYPLAKGRTPDQIFQDWQAQGDTHILLFDTGLQFVVQGGDHPAEYQAFQDALKRWMTPVWTDGFGYTLYKWKTQQ